jgi:cyclophilin family peptidyl-prolyl cis-trans isomerase
MRREAKFVVTWLAVGLLVTAGCSSKDQAAPEAKPAAINGNTSTGADAASGPNLPGTLPAPKVKQPGGDPRFPVVVIETSLGNITVKLNAEKADLTVANFLAYVDSGQYNGTIFHQVFKNYVVLGGGYTPELAEKPATRSVRNQADNGLKNARGMIAMARQADVIDSARAQFFINVADNSALDHQDRSTAEGYGYCVFGEVVTGMDVVDRIANVPVKDLDNFESIPAETVLIKLIRRAP